MVIYLLAFLEFLKTQRLWPSTPTYIYLIRTLWLGRNFTVTENENCFLQTFSQDTVL